MGVGERVSVGTSVNVGMFVGDKSVDFSVSEAVVEVLHEVSDILIKRIIVLNQVIIFFILIQVVSLSKIKHFYPNTIHTKL